MSGAEDSRRREMKENPLGAFLERDAVAASLKGVRHTILVLSGKGGVGKSTVAVNLAASLVREGYRVGLLDIDLHGPSVPKLLRIDHKKFTIENAVIHPVRVSETFKVVSIGFLLDTNSEAVIWRGPRKMLLIKQFIKDVEWGELDYLIVDSPPGTGDEPLTICQLMPDMDGAVIVTTPQDLATIDVEKTITFCRKLNIAILGVIENMSGFFCPRCGERVDIFGTGGGMRMAEKMSVPFLGAIPIDERIAFGSDRGDPCLASGGAVPAAAAFKEIVKRIREVKKGDR